jgi:hypothetical protein
MQAQLAARGVTRLHDARLLIEGIDKIVAANIELILRSTRDEVRKLEQANQQG